MTKPLDPIEATTAMRAGKHTAPDDAPHPAACANCGTSLAGDYCSHCGQHAHNPLTSFRHALEDILESFWHLDGRIFRTLRDLFVPGRVPRDYLAGHRVRYLPPLRLFVILSLLTFFVGKLVLHVDVGAGKPDAFKQSDAFRQATSVEEVRRISSRLQAELDTAERDTRSTPGVRPALIAARVAIQGEAASRIAELRAQQASTDTATNRDTPSAAAPSSTSPASTPDATAADESASSFLCRFNNRPWHAVDNPVRVDWLPGFANAWLNKRAGRTCDNLTHASRDGERLFQQFLGAVPTALFLLIPVFALLLKLCFLGSGRGYLEHAVVALYSHCFLLLMLMALFLLSAADKAGVPGWLTGLASAAVWVFIPFSLWQTQRRVYGGRWWSNALRFGVIGMVYVGLVTFATTLAALQGISS